MFQSGVWSVRPCLQWSGKQQSFFDLVKQLFFIFLCESKSEKHPARETVEYFSVPVLSS